MGKEEINHGGRLQIREMRESDLPVVSRLYTAANPHATATQIADWTGWILQKFPDLALVLERDGEIIGAITGEVKAGGGVGIIEDITIQERHRGRGYGSRLIDELLQRFRTRGVRKVRLEVHYRCAAALPFYYRHGFRMIRVVHDRFGSGHDAIELEREPQAPG